MIAVCLVKYEETYGVILAPNNTILGWQSFENAQEHVDMIRDTLEVASEEFAALEFRILEVSGIEWIVEYLVAESSFTVESEEYRLKAGLLSENGVQYWDVAEAI